MKLFALLSPTWALADNLKPKDKFKRAIVIKKLNSLYLWISVVSVIGVLVYQKFWVFPDKACLNIALPYIVIFPWSYFLLSRCNEIFWAFLRDAFDQLDEKDNPNSTLTYKDKLKLSLKSYLELIINFSLLYALLPSTKEFWSNGKAPTEISCALYFSGVTITTLGYGDISPQHWYPQFLTIYEVFCGFILLPKSCK